MKTITFYFDKVKIDARFNEEANEWQYKSDRYCHHKKGIKIGLLCDPCNEKTYEFPFNCSLKDYKKVKI
jgi:hypothetical protein